ncbi:H(+)-transporting two-sector ATPase [Handroanthus impetiginosus]|uniref:H(+)-transporting two-sector ATPase n=1 Tax=Handroanthus impetiginosus TaxID=429701 RepID=A0A2G9HM02_9LAMI|nr:H(+)-transporting two-sector ATPase [Handroanthus impetiginosus]
MPQLDKFTYFTQFFWSCLFFFAFYIAICNYGDRVLGISRYPNGVMSLTYWEKGRTLISCFGELGGSRGMERNIFYLILKSSYSISSNPGWGITCRNDIMLMHILHGQGSIDF